MKTTAYSDIPVSPDEILGDLPYCQKLSPSLGVNMEKKLPYLIVCRSAGRLEKKIIANESSYIWSAPEFDADELIKDLSLQLADEFGAFMLVEFWINKENKNTFRIMFPEGKAPATIESFEEGLCQFKKQFPYLKIVQDPEASRCRDENTEFFSHQECKKSGILKIGLEIPDFFTEPKSGLELPVFFRYFRKHFSDTIKKGIYEFIRVQTNLGLNSYKLLGRKVLNKSVWEVDKALSDIEKTFEFLLLIAPANSDESYKEFEDNNYNKNPTFHYRLLPIDPDKLKQQLYQIDIDAVDDPSVAFLFREKRDELDTLITMLNERNSREFMLSSIRLFKSVDEELLSIAREILDTIPHEESASWEKVDGEYFMEAARTEIAYYHHHDQKFNSTVEVRDDMVGIMVSKGKLYIGKNYQMARKRVNPLLQHEVGTHVITYFNGSRQPLNLLKTGLAGYDELQEGIAVLSEYLVGGLTPNRLRVLAARVTAAYDMVEGAQFKDVYNDLVLNHKFHRTTAFELVTRIFQSGGYTKDIIYLRGLIRLMHYLEKGGDIDILFIGKIADKHVQVIKELKDRQVLKPVSLYPRYMQDEECLKRLEKVRQGLPLIELIN